MAPNKSELQSDYLQLIGRISLAHGTAEVFLTNLIELYLGDGKGRPVLSKIKNLDRKIDLLRELIEGLESDKKIVKESNHLLEVFEKCRINRNIIIHSAIVTEIDEGVFQWERASSKNIHPTEAVRISIDELTQLTEIYVELGRRLSWLMMFVGQQMGYQVFSGDIQIGLPSKPIDSPPKLRRVDSDELNFRSWRRRTD